MCMSDGYFRNANFVISHLAFLIWHLSSSILHFARINQHKAFLTGGHWLQLGTCPLRWK